LKFNILPLEKLKHSSIFFSTDVKSGSTFFLYTILAIFSIGLIWSLFGEVDEWVPARAILRPTVEIVTVKNEVTGRINERAVRNGDFVQKGDLLWSIEATSLLASLQRINLEIQTIEETIADNHLILSAIQAENPDLAGQSTYAFARSQEILYSYNQLSAQTENGRLSWIQADQLPAAMRSTSEVEQLRNTYLALENQKQAFIPKQEALLISEIRNLSTQLARLREEQTATLENVEASVVTAPITGNVEFLKEFSPGEIVGTNEELIRITPESLDSFTAELIIQQKDIGVVKTGQQVVLRFESFPVSEFQSLKGTLSYIPNESDLNINGDRIFRAQINLSAHEIRNREGTVFPLRAGMAAEARIVTDRTTILRLILKKLDFLT
jgi:multidrug efflux pump subunit AcrA (membrane-fusion protein)